jgi:hypothetical protein
MTTRSEARVGLGPRRVVVVVVAVVAAAVVAVSWVAAIQSASPVAVA